MRSRVSLWQAAWLLLGASALVVSCSSKYSGSGSPTSVMPTVSGNAPVEIPMAADQVAGTTFTKCCAVPEIQKLGATTCYAVSDAALADPVFVAERGLCTVGGTCYYGCVPATFPHSPMSPPSAH
jgi:hypothetical protein